MNFFKRWLDTKLQMPMSYEMRGNPRKDPNCTDPMCSESGIRKDMTMGKCFGGGSVWCNCCFIESDTKDTLNTVRKLFGLKPLR